MKIAHILLFLFILNLSCKSKEGSNIESQIIHRIDKGSGGALQILDLEVEEGKENKFLDGATQLTVAYRAKVKATSECDLKFPLDKSYGHISLDQEFKIADTIIFVKVGDGLWSSVE